MSAALATDPGRAMCPDECGHRFEGFGRRDLIEDDDVGMGGFDDLSDLVLPAHASVKNVVGHDAEKRHDEGALLSQQPRGDERLANPVRDLAA